MLFTTKRLLAGSRRDARRRLQSAVNDKRLPLLPANPDDYICVGNSSVAKIVSTAKCANLPRDNNCTHIASGSDRIVVNPGQPIHLNTLTPRKSGMKMCYQCDKEVAWLAPDSRCGDCTSFTVAQIKGEECEEYEGEDYE